MSRIFVTSDDGGHIAEVAGSAEGFDEPWFVVVCQDHGTLNAGRSAPIGEAVNAAVDHLRGES